MDKSWFFKDIECQSKSAYRFPDRFSSNFSALVFAYCREYMPWHFYLLHCLRILNTFQKCKMEFSFLLNLLEVLKLHKYDQYFFLTFFSYIFVFEEKYWLANTPEWGQLHGAAALFILQKSKKKLQSFFLLTLGP